MGLDRSRESLSDAVAHTGEMMGAAGSLLLTASVFPEKQEAMSSAQSE